MAEKKPIKKAEKKKEQPNKLVVDNQLPPGIGNINKLLIIKKKDNKQVIEER